MISYLLYYNKNNNYSPIKSFITREAVNQFILNYIKDNNLPESVVEEFFILVEEHPEFLI